DDVIRGGVANGGFAHREWLHHGRVGLLVGLWYDADPADHAVFVYLPGRAILAGPVGRRPPADSLLIGVRHLVVLAVVADRLLGPGHLDDFERLLVDVAIVLVNCRAVH